MQFGVDVSHGWRKTALCLIPYKLTKGESVAVFYVGIDQR
jgi:hypothetical protein